MSSAPVSSSTTASVQLPRKRLQRAIWPLLVIVPVMLALVWPSMEVLGASRAYIAALGYWSRAQKDAVVYLLRYAETRDAANYTAFKQVMSIPLGHRVAREAMRENPPNRALARAGFLRGGNAPEDIDKLIWLFVNYHKVPFVAESVRAWDATDEGVEGLLIAGAQLDAMIRTGTATPAAIATIATQVQAINARLDPLQQAFSISLSEGFDRVRWLLFLALSATALLLLLLAWLSARQMIARAVRAEEELAVAERTVSAERDRALVTLQSIGDAVITANADGRIDYLNPIAEKVTGWSNAEAIGRPLEEVVRIVDEHGGNPVAELPQRILRERGPIEIARNATLVRRDGSEVAIAESASRIRARSGEALGIVIVFRDVSRERRMAAQLSYHASHDLLTGLVNRVEFERRLQTALHTIATEQRSHVLLFIDLDRFKNVNDSCGHAAGDQLLRHISNLFAAELRESDTLARLGGDEFGILLENCSVDDALRIAEELRRRTEGYCFVHEGRSFRVGASVGVVPLAMCEPTVHDALAAADRACYIAKESGRNRIEIYAPDVDEAHTRHREHGWGERVAQAIADNHLRLYSQELLPLQPGAAEPHWLEIFVRLQEPGGRLIGPGTFLPAAERFGLMPQLDRWVIANAFERLTQCIASSERVPPCIINLSAASLSDKGLLQFVTEQFKLHGIPHTMICFELTESTVMMHLAQAQRFMEALKALGCCFSLDEFGRGMASFNYARNLPIDMIKIDGMFVRNMMSDAVDAATVDAINRIGHVLGKRTIAELVEDEATLSALRTLGVDYAQGYAVSPVLELAHYMPRAIKAPV